MKAKKLPSGSYRVQKMINGKSYSITFDHKPTQAEIIAAVEKKKRTAFSGNNITFREASEEYVALKKNVLSEASIREYSRMCSRLPEWFQNLKLSEIDQVKMQRLVNEMCSTLSAKTVCDRHAFVQSVLRLFNPSVDIHTTLPKKRQNEPYIPTHEEVKKIIDESVGTQYHIVLQLLCYGLRRSEALALEITDLFEEDGHYFININKALVQDANKDWIIKSTKTVSSERIIPIDDDLAKEILSEVSEGRIFTGYPETISTFLRRTQEKLGMEHFSSHKLRHYFCSTLLEANYDFVTVQKLGGWEKGSQVPLKIYAHSNIQREKEKLIEAGNILKTARS